MSGNGDGGRRGIGLEGAAEEDGESGGGSDGDGGAAAGSGEEGGGRHHGWGRFWRWGEGVVKGLRNWFKPV